MRGKFLAAPAATLLLGVITGNPLAADDLLYREVFPRSNLVAPFESNPNVVGWNVHAGASAVNVAGISSSTHAVVAGNPIHAPAGNPNPALYNAPGTSPTADVGYLYMGQSGQALNAPHLAWTNEFPGSATAGYSLSQVRFSSANGSGTDLNPVRFAAQINGGAWYVTDASSAATGVTTNPLGPGSSFLWRDERIDLTATTWRQLNFTPSSTLALTGPAGLSLPAGSVTAFGLFEDAWTGTLRFDYVELFGTAPLTPEPSTFAMASISLLALGALAFRRSRLAK